APLWAVRGEGDQGNGGSVWGRRFGDPNFSRPLRGCQVIGLDTGLASRGRGFEIGTAQRQWLTQELASLDPATPLVILSHAPLARLFYPWRQWTGDAPEIVPLLSRFHRVVCLHGHTHVPDSGGQRAVAINFPKDLKPESPNHISLPATSWALPLARQGTPTHLRPGTGPQGCGWALVTLGKTFQLFQPYLWPA
ncbi:MAG TPA: metallophosphoesterase, partial [Desulfobaccales bacterium]|nr:metallophosphoesterase [Desulfobaccales bacterium]